MKNYDLWLFLDLDGYGQSDVARVIEKSCRKTPEFRGKHKNRLYFEFENKDNKASFIYTVVMELNRQGYRWQMSKEEDPNTPQTTNSNDKNIKRRLISGYQKLGRNDKKRANRQQHRSRR